MTPSATHQLPLHGRRVVITRSEADAVELVRRIEALGAQAVVVPTIRIEFSDPAPLDVALARLTQYHWVIFTSRNGVDAVFRRTDSLRGPRVAAIGPATAAALRRHGVEPDLIPAEHVAEALLEALGDVRGLRFFSPRAEIARPTLTDGLRSRGALVDDVTAYRTQTERAPRPDLTGVDAVTFTSASTVRGFVAGGPVPPGARIICIGPVTATAARECGLDVSEVAGEYTEDGLIDALVAALQHRSR